MHLNGYLVRSPWDSTTAIRNQRWRSFNMEERGVESQMLAGEFSRHAIPVRVGRARSTIGRQLMRNGLANRS
jgi:hypothetical protein